jgi:hypothetical protein
MVDADVTTCATSPRMTLLDDGVVDTFASTTPSSNGYRPDPFHMQVM